jgi:tetratricopeptide (TPR) repeat protein
VRPLLPPGDGCFTVVTSRDHMESLVAREGSAVVRLGPLTDEAAAALVAAASGRALPADSDSTTRLVHGCGRLPLALRIAAARLALDSDLDVATLAGNLGRDRDGGLTALGLLDDSEADVAAAFDLSYRFVSPDAARVLRFLGVFPSDDVSVEGLMAALELSRPQAERHLQELASASLIDATAAGRFTLHDLVRQFTLRQWSGNDERALGEVAARRLVDYYLDGVDVADRVIRPMRQRPAPTPRFPPAQSLTFADQAEALAWIDAEYRNLVACVAGAREHGWNDAAWQIADCLYSYHLRRNRYAEWLKVDTAALEAAAAAGDRVGERRIHTGISAVLTFSRRYDDALAHLATALELATADGNGAAAASIHTMMSAAYGYGGRLEDCYRHAMAGYEGYLRAGMQHGAIASLLNAGIAQIELGTMDDAVATLERTLEQARVHLAREQELADVLGHLADAYRGAGRIAEAGATAAEAVTVARDLEHPMGEAQALTVLGKCLRDADRRTATGHLRRAIDIFRELDRPEEAAKVEAELSAW